MALGGNGASSAQQAANATDAQRQANIAATTNRINSIFTAPARTQQYSDLGTALNSFYTADANRQKAIADRNLTFSMARSGLTGGSAAADAGNTLGDEYSRGILSASQKAQGAVAGLEQQDQTTRAQLTQLAENGMNATTAASQADSALRANVGNAQANATTTGLGDIFGQTAQLYQQQQQAAATRRQLQTPLGGIYGQPAAGSA